MSQINIKESLNDLDKRNDCKYNLRTLYEGTSLSINESSDDNFDARWEKIFGTDSGTVWNALEFRISAAENMEINVKGIVGKYLRLEVALFLHQLFHSAVRTDGALTG